MKKNSIPRRDFLKRSVAAAAFSMPAIVPNTVFGADAPSNRVNVGQIGCGNISNYHTNYLKQMPDVRVLAVCDAYQSRRDAKAAFFDEHYGGKEITKAHADFRELLARPDIDAVVVAAHDNWHTSVAADPMESHCHQNQQMHSDLSDGDNSGNSC